MPKSSPTPAEAPAPYVFDRWRRGKPLRRCPALACKREGRCLTLATTGNCLKTHFNDYDEMAIEITRQINRFLAREKRENPGWVEPPDDGSPPDLRPLKKALERRIADHEAEEAHKLQLASRPALANPPAVRKT